MADTHDEKFLLTAFELSRKSLSSGGFPVGALLVRDGREISRGLSCTETTGDVTAHGEMQAIRAAGREAVPPLTLYSSLEPCLMCLAAAAWAGVNRIVYGCRRSSVDPSYYVNKTGAAEAAVLLSAPPKLVLMAEFEEEIISLIREYEKRYAGKAENRG